MLGLLTRSRRPARPAAPRPVRPCLEWLEARDCPSYLSLNVAYGAGKQITLYGTLMSGAQGNSTPGFSAQDATSAGTIAGATVAFSGSAAGSVATDSNGNFAYTTNALSLGEVDAATTDGQSNVAKVVLSSGGAPFISNFKAVEEGNSHYWDITGSVTDGNFSAAGLVVHITGAPATIYNGGQGVNVTVDQNGNFDLCICLNGTSSDNGGIYASTTDSWGQQSNMPMWTIMQPGT